MDNQNRLAPVNHHQSSIIRSADSSVQNNLRKQIQQQLVLLLHAKKCQRREQQQRLNRNEPVRECVLPYCPTMKQVIVHMTDCSAGKQCPFLHCSSSRQILKHWENCPRTDCPVCGLLKQAIDRRRPPQAPLAHAQAWQSEVNLDLRQHLVQKIVRAFFSNSNLPQQDQRLINLFTYAKKAESDMYEKANSREEYNHLITEKIVEIQKDLEEIKQKRKREQQRQELFPNLSLSQQEEMVETVSDLMAQLETV